MSRHDRRTLVTLIAATVALLLAPTVPVNAAPLAAVGGDHGGGGWGGGGHDPRGELPKQPLMTGSGGAVASVDRDAS